MKGITLFRAIGFCGSTLTVLALAWYVPCSLFACLTRRMNVGSVFAGQTPDIRGAKFEAGVVSVCLAVLITKYYLVSVRAAMGRLRSDEAATMERCLA